MCMCSLPIASPWKLDMVLTRDGTKSHMQTQPFKTVSSGLCEVRNSSCVPIVGNADETLWILEDGQRIWSGTRPDLAEQIGRSAKDLSLTHQEFREMWQSWIHAIHINIRGDIAAKWALTPMLTFRILFLYSLFNLSFFFLILFWDKTSCSQIGLQLAIYWLQVCITIPTLYCFLSAFIALSLFLNEHVSRPLRWPLHHLTGATVTYCCHFCEETQNKTQLERMEGYIGLCSEAKWSIVTAEPQLMAGYMAVAIRKQKKWKWKWKKKAQLQMEVRSKNPAPSNPSPPAVRAQQQGVRTSQAAAATREQVFKAPGHCTFKC